MPDADALVLVRAFSRELALAGGLLAPDYLESGMSLGEARCLWELGHAPATVSELARRLGLDLGYVSRVASRLAAQGLARKQTGAGDRRTRGLLLTRAGRARLALLGRRADRRLGAWLERKGTGGVEQLLAGLRAFLSASLGGGAVTLRDARPGDVGWIIARHAALYAEEHRYPPAFEGYVVAAFASFLADLAPLRDRILVAERDGTLLGSVAVKGLPAGRAQLRFLLVERAARGAGLGRRLVQAVIDHARAAGERELVLETASDLDAARGLYASCGFRKTKTTRGVDWLPRGVGSETWTLALAP